MQNCLVTGATGFIGSQLCPQLAAAGINVIAHSSDGRAVEGSASTVAFDLHNEIPEIPELADVDTLFHLAAIAHQRAPKAAYWRVNFKATVELARRAAAAGVKTFIFLSSVKAMGPAQGDEPRCEQDCTLPEDPYGFSKWHAEEFLRQEYASGGMSVVIVRPALVYGRGARGNLAMLEKGIRRGLPRPPEHGARSMIGRDDLVSLLKRLAESPPAGVSTCIVTDGEAYSTQRLYDVLCAVQCHRRGRVWPLGLWRIACAVLDMLGTGGSYQRLFGTELYTSDKLANLADWRPCQRFEDEAADMFEHKGS